MAVMLADVYDALREAGASEASARRAAEAVAVRETRFDQIEAGIAAFEQRTEARISAFEQRTEARFDAIETRLTRLEGEVALLKLMVGTVGALSIAILVKLFTT